MLPSIVDLFCGVGGFSLGAAQAGFRPVAGLDIDADLLSGYQLNFPKSQSVQADLSGLKIEAWAKILGALRPCGVIGGPPCQGFSRIGKRADNDLRNELVRCFIDHVCFLRPAFFVMENVEGMLDSVFQDILQEALSPARSYYRLVGPLRLNAASVGVPTERHRAIIVGYDPKYMNPLKEEDFTPPNDSEVTVRDAISDLPQPNPNDDGVLGWSRYPKRKYLSAYARTMRRPLPNGIGWAEAREKRRHGQLSGFHSTEHTEPVIRRFSDTQPGKIEPISRYPRLHWDGCCPTLRAGTGVERGSFQAARPIHPVSARVVTVREAARLQGFPDSFVFHRAKWHSFRMIGNSVAPPVAFFAMSVINKKLKSLPLVPIHGKTRKARSRH